MRQTVGRFPEDRIRCNGYGAGGDVVIFYPVNERSQSFAAQKLLVYGKGGNAGAERRCLRHVVEPHDHGVLRDMHVQALQRVAHVARHEIVAADKAIGHVFQL